MDIISLIISLVSLILAIVSLYLAKKYNHLAEITNEKNDKMLESVELTMNKLALYMREVELNKENGIFLRKDRVEFCKLQGYKKEDKAKIMEWINKHLIYTKKLYITRISNWLDTDENNLSINLSHALNKNQGETLVKELNSLKIYGIQGKYNIRF